MLDRVKRWLLAMLALSLRRCGFSVSPCSCPDAALQRLVAGRFDWLVTDARLRSGEELTGELLAGGDA